MSRAGKLSPRYKWELVVFLCVVAMVNYADRTAISAVFPLLGAELGMSDVALAALGSFFLWSYAVGSPFAGVLADRFSRSRLVVLSLTAWSLVTIWTGFAHSATELLVMRIMLGVTECAYLPAALALMADHHDTDTRATAMGLHLAGLNFGLIAGGTLAGYLGDHLGWRPSFYILGAAGLLLAGAGLIFLRDRPRDAVDSASARPSWGTIGTDLRALSGIVTWRLLVGSGMLISIGTWIFFNWLPLYYKETFNLSLTAAGFSGTFMLQMTATVGAIAGGWLSDRVSRNVSRRRMLFGAVCYFGAAPLLLGFLVHPTYALVSVFIAGFALLRALGSITEPTVTCDLLQPRLRSTALALMNTANCLAGGIGVLVAGFLKSRFGLGGVFAGVSVIMFVAAGLVLAGYLVYFIRDAAERNGQVAR
ncbi:MAG: MFS transporter [Acidobacteriales bacterium]|nr:MFS transporter [Terriglobales bacterium]